MTSSLRGPSGAPARALVVSLRRLRPHTSRAAHFELEDVIASVDAVDLLAPDRPLGPPPRLQRALHRLGRAAPGARALAERLPCPLERRYDLVFVMCQHPSDLYLLGPLRAWRRRCGALACVIDELWAHAVPECPGEMDLLAQFDHLFVGLLGTVPALRAATGRPTSFLPPGVDAIRFCPPALDAPRPVDVYNMGRRAPAPHQALLELARERGWLYLYSSVVGHDVHDAAEHRLQLASTVQRTRYFVAHRPRLGDLRTTGGQEEVGYRYFEGAAGGAVLLGEEPRCEAFRRLFAYEDAVVPLPSDAADVAATIDALEADPERVARIRARHLAASLGRHDWSYRWEQVLAACGLAPHPALRTRRERLAALAERVALPAATASA